VIICYCLQLLLTKNFRRHVYTHTHTHTHTHAGTYTQRAQKSGFARSDFCLQSVSVTSLQIFIKLDVRMRETSGDKIRFSILVNSNIMRFCLRIIHFLFKDKEMIRLQISLNILHCEM